MSRLSICSTHLKSNSMILFLWLATSIVCTWAAPFDPATLNLNENNIIGRGDEDLVDSNNMPNSVELSPMAPDYENNIYLPFPKRTVEDPQQLQKLLRWREEMARWLIANANANVIPNSQRHRLVMSQAAGKRNGGTYMCHFKLCQLGVTAGKRIWNI